MRPGKNRIRIGLSGNFRQVANRQTRNSPESGFAGFNDFLDSRNGLVEHLRLFYKLNIVKLNQVDTISFQAKERLVDAFQNPVVGKIKVLQSVPPAFSGKENLISPSLQRFSETGFRQGQTIKRRHIKEINAMVKGIMHSPDSVLFIRNFENISHGRGSKTKN